MNIGLLISSHKSYYVPRHKLHNSLRDNKLGKAIWVVGDGYSDEGDRIAVDHNSFDFTGLVAVVEKPSLIDGYSHLLCLQDTMECGRLTRSLVSRANANADATAAYKGQCNLVLYSVQYLMMIKEIILSLKNCSKEKAIKWERGLWEMAPNAEEFDFSGVVSLGSERPYGGSLRTKEYYPALDVIKWKANSFAVCEASGYVVSP